jgi:hypothetical protein
MYQDLYLSFPDEASAKAVLYRTEGATEDTEGTEVGNYANIDTLGVIFKATGEADAEDNPVFAPITSWHVNVRLVEGEDATALEPFQVSPATPSRVWG